MTSKKVFNSQRYKLLLKNRFTYLQKLYKHKKNGKKTQANATFLSLLVPIME